MKLWEQIVRGWRPKQVAGGLRYIAPEGDEPNRSAKQKSRDRSRAMAGRKANVRRLRRGR